MKTQENTNTITLTPDQALTCLDALVAWKELFKSYDTNLAYNAYFQESLTNENGETSEENEELETKEKAELEKVYEQFGEVRDILGKKLFPKVLAE